MSRDIKPRDGTSLPGVNIPSLYSRIQTYPSCRQPNQSRYVLLHLAFLLLGIYTFFKYIFFLLQKYLYFCQDLSLRNKINGMNLYLLKKNLFLLYYIFEVIKFIFLVKSENKSCFYFCYIVYSVHNVVCTSVNNMQYMHCIFILNHTPRFKVYFFRLSPFFNTFKVFMF